MDNFDSRPRESAGRDNPEGKSGNQDHAKAELAAISLAICGLALDDELRPFAKQPDTSAVGADVPGVHPDAQDVLARLQRKFASPAMVAGAVIQEVYRSLLRDRQTALKLDRVLREFSPSLAKLLAEIDARCGTKGDDVVYVWQRASRRDPENAVTSFPFERLSGAQHDVAVDRRRSDAIGAGAAHWNDQQIRGRAMKLLGEELGLSETDLLNLDLKSYKPDQGAILLNGSDRPRPLSEGTCAAINAWIKVRGPEGQDLFPPALARCPREFAIGGSSQGFWNAVPAQNDCEERVEREDELENLSQELGTNARALICSRMQEEGGNWSFNCLEKLRDHQPVEAASPDPGEHNAKLTKQQKQICEAIRRQKSRRKDENDPSQ